MIDYQAELRELKKRLERLELKILPADELRQVQKQRLDFERWKVSQAWGLLAMFFAIVVTLGLLWLTLAPLF